MKSPGEMSVTRFDANLPKGFRYVEARDKRTDDDIIEALTAHRPVESERNIWCFWHSGVKAMPSWCQRNVVNWVRLHGAEWTVRLLDNVPDSPNNALRYLPSDLLPEAWNKGTMTGPFVGQHSADFIRTAALYTHGGVWMDVGIFLFRHMDDICWRQLEDPQSPFEMSVPHTNGCGMANYFVASRRGSPFVKHWHDLFLYFWKDKTSCDGLASHPLIVPILIAIQNNSNPEERSRFGFEWAVPMHVVFEYVAQIMAWTRLCMTENTGDDGFNGTEYYTTKVLLWDALEESWNMEKQIGWKGDRQLEVLSTRLDSPPESEEYKTAHRLVWTLLAEASMQKVYHGKTVIKYTTLGTLWDRSENEGKDQTPGTFAELLRHGSIHYQQDRQIQYMKAKQPRTLLKTGLYEP